MTLEKKISQAKAKLLVEYPYFGTLASRLVLRVNDDIESFKSDGETLEYREAYLKELSYDEVSFLLANGAMHKALAHQNRKANRSGWLWQMATDMAINDMLVQNGMPLPYGAQYRKRFEGMYAEEIYEELKADILREDEDLEYESDTPEDVKPQQNSSQNKTQTRNETTQILEEELFSHEAMQLLEQQLQEGQQIQSIERFFSLQTRSSRDWREELRSAIARYFQDDFVMMPPAKKLLSQGIYLPSSISQTFRFVIAVDSSGSVDENLLNSFLGEVNFIMEVTRNYVIELLVCDDRVREHKSFYSGDMLHTEELYGGGGTDFRPVFEFIEHNFDDVQLLLYFSDLEGIFPEQAPAYSVKWVSPKEGNIPFGELLVLD